MLYISTIRGDTIPSLGNRSVSDHSLGTKPERARDARPLEQEVQGELGLPPRWL